MDLLIELDFRRALLPPDCEDFVDFALHSRLKTLYLVNRKGSLFLLSPEHPKSVKRESLAHSDIVRVKRVWSLFERFKG